MPFPPAPPAAAGAPPSLAKASVKDLKKRLVDDGGDMDAMLAEMSEDETPAEHTAEPKDEAGLETEPEGDKGAAIDPEVKATLMEYGPPERWTSDVLKTVDPVLLKKCSDAYDAMDPAEQAKVQAAWKKAQHIGPAGRGPTMGME